MSLSQSELKASLYYDPATGVFTWRRARGMAVIGSVAGSPGPKGHIGISVNGRLYRASRLAFLYMTGEWPRGQVDHRNLTTSDNRWENLRDATQSQNLYNRPLQSNNRSGHKGVSFDKKSNKWRAIIGVDGKTIHLGRHPTKEAAAKAYASAAQRYHGEFARLA